MTGIRFIHTDNLRLASPVTGLAAAPEWLRRNARDATRQAVINLCDMARHRAARFLLIAGQLTESPDDLPGVRSWLKSPLQTLRRQGIGVAIAARHPQQAATLTELCDVVVHPRERLVVIQRDGEVRLKAVPAATDCSAELAVEWEQESSGPPGHGRIYRINPGNRAGSVLDERGCTVHSAGAPQALDPHEVGPFGCLLVDLNSDETPPQTTFEATDVLRFVAKTIDETAIRTADDVCRAVLSASAALSRREPGTQIVDWRITQDLANLSDIVEFAPAELLQRVRDAMQQGHVGVWPRRLDLNPSNVELAAANAATGLNELASVLKVSRTLNRNGTVSILPELVKGAQLLRAA